MIKKFKLEKFGTTCLFIPIRELLSTQMQNDDLVVWVDTANKEPRNWTFYSLYTGDSSPANAAYIGTVQDKSLVYHVYAS